MSIIAFTSAGGAPGVTATALGLACVWPRRVIAAEADPVGGSAMLAGYFGGFQHSTSSLVDLVLAQRNGRLAEQLPAHLVSISDTPASILPGPRSHAQARGVLELWQPLCSLWRAMDTTSGGPNRAGAMLAYQSSRTGRTPTTPPRPESDAIARNRAYEQSGLDILIDAGRLGMEAYPEPVLAAADLVVLVIRSDLVSLAAAKQWSEAAQARYRDHPGSPPWVAVMIDPGQPYGAREVATGLGIPVVSSVRRVLRGSALQPENLTARRPTPLMTDLMRCGEAIREHLAAQRTPLDPTRSQPERTRPGSTQTGRPSAKNGGAA